MRRIKEVGIVVCVFVVMIIILAVLNIDKDRINRLQANAERREVAAQEDCSPEVVYLDIRCAERWTGTPDPMLEEIESEPEVDAEVEPEVKESNIVEIIPKIKPGVVHIQCPNWQGSGFVVGKNLIATARHCVEHVENFVITTNKGHKLHATKALSSKKYDIAFICVDDLTCQLEKGREIECDKVKHKVKLHVLELGSITECQLGQELITIGSPYGKVNFNSVTLGIISGLDRDYDELNNSGYYGEQDYGWSVAFQTDSPGHPGNSGCAIFTADGVVRGILVGGWSPSLIIAIPTDIFLEDLEEIKRMFVQDKYYREEKPAYTDPYYNYVEDNDYYVIP